ncbi:MAG: hypothetical protein FWH14_01535 [Oscillospiraceae bacterium]|nr:hypothetical protein [Oscillospiraceae bacterium]
MSDKKDFSVDDILRDLKSGEGSSAGGKTSVDDILKDVLERNRPKQDEPEPETDRPAVNQNAYDNVNVVKSQHLRQSIINHKKQGVLFREPEVSQETKRISVKTETPEVKKGYLDPGYTKPYNNSQSEDDFRERRRRAAEDFELLIPRSHEEQEDSGPQETSLQRLFEMPGLENEYTSPDQTDEITSSLRSNRQRVKKRLSLLLLLSLIAAYINLYPDYFPAPEFMMPSNNPHVYALLCFIVILAGVFVSLSAVAGGLVSMIRLRPERDSLLSVAVLGSLVQISWLTFISPAAVNDVNVYLLLSMLFLLFNAFGKYLIIRRSIINFVLISYNKSDHYSLDLIDDSKYPDDPKILESLTRGLSQDDPCLAVNRKTGFLTKFMHYSYSEDISDKISRYILPFALVAALGLAVFQYWQGSGVAKSLSVLSLTLLAVCPMGYMLAVNLPLFFTAKRISEFKAGVLGYQAAEEYSGVNCHLVNSKDLFPDNAITLRGIKTYSGYRIDEVILDAASVLYKADSMLSGVFLKILTGRKELLREVDSLVHENMMGISAWIDDKRILIGGRELMEHHNVVTPSRDYEKKAGGEDSEYIYLAVSGVLATLFIVKLKFDYTVDLCLQSMSKNKIDVAVKCTDFLVSNDKLADMYGIDPDMIKIIPSIHNNLCDQQTAYAPALSGGVFNSGGFFSRVCSMLSAKRLPLNIRMGIIAFIASSVIGFGIALVYTFTEAAMLTPLEITIYHMVWILIVSGISIVRRT